MSEFARAAAAAAAARNTLLVPPKMPRRILHTMLRVGDLAKSVAFYTEVLGMRVLRTTDRPEHKYSLTFVGYEEEASAAVLELTYNYGVDRYDMGSAFGHIAISVDNAAATCEAVAKAGYTVSRPAGPVLGGTTVIAFVVDPVSFLAPSAARAPHIALARSFAL